MEDDIVLLDEGIMFGGQDMFGQTYSPLRNIGRVSGRATSAAEQMLLSDVDFTFDRRRRGLLSRIAGGLANTFSLGLADMATGSRRSGLQNVSRSVTLSGVSQSDYEDLLNIDLFRGGSFEDVTDTEISQGRYRANQAGQVARVGGEELSLLGEAELEELAEVVRGRQSSIVGRALSPGLQNQSFSLLSGNFGT